MSLRGWRENFLSASVALVDVQWIDDNFATEERRREEEVPYMELHRLRQPRQIADEAVQWVASKFR